MSTQPNLTTIEVGFEVIMTLHHHPTTETFRPALGIVQVWEFLYVSSVNQTKLITSIKDNIQDSIQDKIKDKIKNNLKDNFKDNLQDKFQDSFQDSFRDNFQDSF